MNQIIEEIKKKKEFSGLPDSVVSRAAKLSGGDVKEARAILRKYFGVFLTNKVLKGRDVDVLKSHISSQGRNYEEFYARIFESIKGVGSVIDLGCGVNGFSYGSLKEVLGEVDYIGVEASGQLVNLMNEYFKKEGIKGEIFCKDLFEVEEVLKILRKAKKPPIVLLFQVIDALESFEKDFSKKFIKEISKECEKIVISLPLFSISGRKKFSVQRKWLIDFLEDNFIVEEDFQLGSERMIVISPKAL